MLPSLPLRCSLLQGPSGGPCVLLELRRLSSSHFKGLHTKRVCDARCPARSPHRVALRVNAGTLVACGNVLATVPGGLCLLPAAGSVAGSAIDISGPCCAPPGLQLTQLGCRELLSEATSTVAQQDEATLAVPIMEGASAAGAVVLTADRRCFHLR